MWFEEALEVGTKGESQEAEMRARKKKMERGKVEAEEKGKAR